MRVLASLISFLVGFAWARRRAAARFRRRLRRQGLPAEVADILAAEYGAAVRLVDLLRRGEA